MFMFLMNWIGGKCVNTAVLTAHPLQFVKMNYLSYKLRALHKLILVSFSRFVVKNMANI